MSTVSHDFTTYAFTQDRDKLLGVFRSCVCNMCVCFRQQLVHSLTDMIKSS